jgi:hypothetical protein
MLGLFELLTVISILFSELFPYTDNSSCSSYFNLELGYIFYPIQESY